MNFREGRGEFSEGGLATKSSCGGLVLEGTSISSSSVSSDESSRAGLMNARGREATERVRMQ